MVVPAEAEGQRRNAPVTNPAEFNITPGEPKGGISKMQFQRATAKEITIPCNDKVMLLLLLALSFFGGLGFWRGGLAGWLLSLAFNCYYHYYYYYYCHYYYNYYHYYYLPF